MYLSIYSYIYLCIYLFMLSYLYTQNIPQDGGWTNRGEKKNTFRKSVIKQGRKVPLWVEGVIAYSWENQLPSGKLT